MKKMILIVCVLFVLVGCKNGDLKNVDKDKAVSKEQTIKQEKTPEKPKQVQLTDGIHPVLGWNSRVLGGIKDGQWINNVEMAKELKGNEIYNVYGLEKKVGEVSSKKIAEETYIDGSKGYRVEFKDTKETYGYRHYYLSGAWNSHPRNVTEIKLAKENENEYIEKVKSLAKSQGLGEKFEIKEIYECDIEGDGKSEEIIVSTNIKNEELDALTEGNAIQPKGKFSMISLHRNDEDSESGDVLLLQKEYLSMHEVHFIADIDADGVFELGLDEENIAAVATEGFSLSTLCIVDYKDGKWDEIARLFSNPI